MTTSLDNILPKNDPRRAKLANAGFDLNVAQNVLVLQGEAETHPTVVLQGAGDGKNGVTVLCTEVQFCPFKEGDEGGGAPIFFRKPVVYLYPTTTMDVKVELHVDGEFVAQYPRLTGNAWHVKASPNGEIFDPATERRFPYLFWEAQRKTPLTIDAAQAHCVKSADAARFLEDAAAKYALNDRERTDYVTYWLPALERNPYSLVQFLSETEYAKYAEMKITPAPETVNRLFMIFQRVNAPLKVGSPTLAQRDRRGFTVIEWGGANLDER